ncbi:hypothetical protein MLN10_10590 [Escherichia coli]|nr:hypothetical protein [Escherichia coli]
MSLADEVAELRRRVADMVRRGVVDEVIPGSPVMVRVDSSENGPTEFLEWVKNTNPGQYAVAQCGSVNRHNPIIKGVVFTGIVDIKIPDTVASNASPDNKGKVVTFYGVNGEIYYTETGEPFGSPTQPAINRECDCANDMKKDAGASHIAP